MTASILIPAFNAEDTLEATLESCVLQGVEWVEEVIVVDNLNNVAVVRRGLGMTGRTQTDQSKEGSQSPE